MLVCSYRHCQVGNVLPKKAEIPKGRGGGGVHDYGILRTWGGGVAHSEIIFRRQGGVKTWKPSVVGYGYFLELPNLQVVLNTQNTANLGVLR